MISSIINNRKEVKLLKHNKCCQNAYSFAACLPLGSGTDVLGRSLQSALGSCGILNILS